jgi:hypothetical protein
MKSKSVGINMANGRSLPALISSACSCTKCDDKVTSPVMAAFWLAAELSYGMK